tara:strand:- start:611 stop:910 length:300 start_codon:yes stop_codon:yes gene_type:complete
MINVTEDWCYANKKVIDEIYVDRTLLLRFFELSDPFWDFLPDRHGLYAEYAGKLSEIKKMAGCSSCMINGLKNEYVGELNSLIERSKRDKVITPSPINA